MGSRTAQKRRKQKRPQWQDVSIDLSAIQAAQEQVGTTMSHADRPVGPMRSTDAAGAAHMSGVSPASPSPPKQLPQNIPFPKHKSHSSVPTLPALASAGACLPEAFTAWHENVALDQQQHHYQQYQHRLGQNAGTARESLPFASAPALASQQLQSSQAPLPNCLPPLHHQPRASLSAPGLQTSADFALLQSQYHTQAPHHQFAPLPHDSQGMHTRPLSSSHLAQQASNEALPLTFHQHTERPDSFASGLSRQVASEDPRSARQVPLQYMRHPCGSGAPGGLHRLHRMLRPVARSQHDTASSSSAGEQASTTVWATHAATELFHHNHESCQKGAVAEPESMLHPWHAQPSHHQQRRASVERQSSPVMMHQQPAQQAPAVSQSDYSGWQQRDDGQQLEPGPPFSTACDHRGSSHDQQAAGDMQDVNMRLQQV